MGKTLVCEDEDDYPIMSGPVGVRMKSRSITAHNIQPDLSQAVLTGISMSVFPNSRLNLHTLPYKLILTNADFTA